MRSPNVKALSMHVFTMVLLTFQAPFISLLMSFKITREMLKLMDRYCLY